MQVLLVARLVCLIAAYLARVLGRSASSTRSLIGVPDCGCVCGLVCLIAAASVCQPISKIYTTPLFFKNGAKSGFEMCFDIGSRHLGCWGPNTSRIQNKEVYATLCAQSEGSCQQSNPHFLCDLVFAGTDRPTRQQQRPQAGTQETQAIPCQALRSNTQLGRQYSGTRATLKTQMELEVRLTFRVVLSLLC